MKEKYYIEKWLSDDLSEADRQAFEQSDAFDSLLRIDTAAQHFRAPNFNLDQNYQNLLHHKQKNKIAINYNRQWFLRIAALFVIGIGIGSYFLLNKHSGTTIETLAAMHKEVILPDNSQVILNSVSELSFKKNSWKNNRIVKLDGEAFFKVAKGQKFDVITSTGTVSVLGTQFNVKERDGLFEVTCFEGLVAVKHHDKNYQIPAGNTIQIQNNNINKNTVTLEKPDWTAAKSSFKSIPYKEVFAELERQYGVTIQYQDIDVNVKFTGSFTHNNLSTALQSITIPLQLKFSIKNQHVIISK